MLPTTDIGRPRYRPHKPYILSVFFISYIIADFFEIEERVVPEFTWSLALMVSIGWNKVLPIAPESKDAKRVDFRMVDDLSCLGYSGISILKLN